MSREYLAAFHNTPGPEERDESSGMLLPRVPESIRSSLSPRGRFIAASSTGVEIRFVTEAPGFRVTLSSLVGNVTVDVYQGGFKHSEHLLVPGSKRTLHLDQVGRFSEVPKEKLMGCFHPDVWRIVFSTHGEAVYFHGIDTFGYACRPPSESRANY